jgi:hypothetical protein
MAEEKKEIESSEEDEKIESDDGSEKESDESEDKKSEEEESQVEGFEKESETVPAGKYNQAIRKLREKELEERELRKQLAEKPVKKENKKEEDDDDDEDFFKDDEKKSKKDLDIDSIVEKKVKPILERLTKQEQDDKKKQRDAFFTAHPKYLNDSKEWQALLDEMDESINPNKGTYYEQLTKAHRILSGGTSYNKDVESKKREMAAEIGSSDKGARKSDSKPSDDRADRLAKNMPIGYTYTGK